jgi:hypothetical protein
MPPAFGLIFGCQALRQGNIFDEVPLFDFIMIKIHDYAARWTPYHFLCWCRERAKSTTFLKNIRGYMGVVSASACTITMLLRAVKSLHKL